MATLSKASPAASSRVAPSKRYCPHAGTSSSSVWPPETSSAPTSPGPWVTATASTAPQPTPASTRARSTTAGRAARCARLASSGTTPPKTLCTSCDRMTRLASSGARPPPTSTAADVSSQEVSIPSTTSATARLALEGDGVGHHTRPDPGRRRHGEAGVAARPRLADQVRRHAHAVLGEGVDLRLRAAHGHAHPLGSEQEPREPGRGGRDGHSVDRALDDRRHFARDPPLLRRDADDAERRRVERDGPEERAVDARNDGGQRGDRVDG